MWTATIHSKDFKDGVFRAFIKYTDGVNSFDEAVPLSTQENLNRAVKNRIQQLEEAAAFSSSVPVGPFTPTPENKTSYELAVSEVTRVKNLVNLGILKETDPEFTNAVSNLKSEYAKL